MFTIDVAPKTETEVVDVTVDFSPYIPFGQIIDSVIPSVTTYSGKTGLSVALVSASDYTATVRVSNGNLGSLYNVIVPAQLSDGIDAAGKLTCVFPMTIVPEIAP